MPLCGPVAPSFANLLDTAPQLDPSYKACGQPSDSEQPYKHEQTGYQNRACCDERQKERDRGDEGGNDLNGSGAHEAINV